MPNVLNDYGMPSESLRLPRGHLPRPRLCDALLQADCRLRMLCAPAGSGKSVILGECAQRCPAGTRLIYLDLQDRHKQPDAWLQRLAYALAAASADKHAIVTALESLEQPLWIFLDNYPRLPDSPLDSLLNDLILSSRHRTQWWIASRRRPQMQLARLLLEGELFELDAAELAFSENEVEQLLKSGGQQWPRTAIGELYATSQGWCAGVRLRLLGVASGQPASVERNDAMLADYMKSEVLFDLPDDWQYALFSLAHLHDFDAALCEQLLGVGEGGQLLEQLIACGLFIEPTGTESKRFRVFPMLAPLLAAQLPAPMSKAVYRNACQWHVSQGEVRSALEYALKADQPEVAASLMQHYTRDHILQGRSLALLTQWCNELPDSLLSSTPRLVLLNAWAQLLGGRLDQAREYVEQLVRFTPQPNAMYQQDVIAQWKAVVANVAFHRGTAEQARSLLQEAVEELPEYAWGQRLFCCALQAEQALIEGRFDEVQAVNRRGIKQARELASLAMESIFALSHVKLLELRGELLRGETLLKQLYHELSIAWNEEPSPIRARVQLRRGALHLQRGHFDEAQACFQAGLQECRDCADPVEFWGHLGLAELDGLFGDFASGFSRIAHAERLLQVAHVSVPMYQGPLIKVKARLLLRQGRWAQAETALLELPRQAMRFSPYGMPDLHLRLRLLLLQAQLAGGAENQTVEALCVMHRQTLEEGRRPLACEVGLILAEGLYETNRTDQAKQVMRDALAMARQMGLVTVERDFALRNPTLMRWGGETGGPQGAPQTLLTRRERDVLKLIAKGYSNQQIADTLFISLHTVKTHAQRVNTKLGVARRTQAVVRAKELGLAD
ncbi:LuxR C-terminal-related transcriptional regulator [Pseudomonas akapageensis]|uniref:LuxR C-terminal-related transcriptional regulator n=1 Tax=Pseudomonas akapageensis TaxID=2609961 RepID=UPI0024844BCD|nr:LuxR C-terminal-related transcriptional regulator [Pseudomonas akapageensis]